MNLNFGKTHVIVGDTLSTQGKGLGVRLKREIKEQSIVAFDQVFSLDADGLGGSGGIAITR